jgi:hypothetical protein
MERYRFFCLFPTGDFALPSFEGEFNALYQLEKALSKQVGQRISLQLQHLSAQPDKHPHRAVLYQLNHHHHHALPLAKRQTPQVVAAVEIFEYPVHQESPYAHHTTLTQNLPTA